MPDLISELLASFLRISQLGRKFAWDIWKPELGQYIGRLINCIYPAFFCNKKIPLPWLRSEKNGQSQALGDRFVDHKYSENLQCIFFGQPRLTPNVTRPDLYRRQATPSGSVQDSFAFLLAMARRGRYRRACPCRVRTLKGQSVGQGKSTPCAAAP